MYPDQARSDFERAGTTYLNVLKRENNVYFEIFDLSSVGCSVTKPPSDQT